ncbi:YDG domain-containing protein [Lacibacter sediminis]|uniref:T9SS type A sorting domain-containing protein n=1 Tax=Lacibacter sediminis TaxID=2760713 RepID=A0A7G5XD10_9BACT|nr:YDG domain-containing protein [Lacibacter sediminis]QNA43363.1 T9SS type A sorting domain-containing protein [Lacibacter sediminis]
MPQLLSLSVNQRATTALLTPFYFLLPSKKILLRFAMLVMSVAMMSGVVGQATVTTDKPDYQPGDTVVITGTGWQPGETVTLDVEEDPKPATCLLPHDLVAVADADGKIYSKEFLIKENHLGVTFTLTATGQSSGLVAVTTFTDALFFSASITSTPSSVCAGTTGSYTITISNNTSTGPGETPSGQNARLGSVRIAIPLGFTGITITDNSLDWTVSLSTPGFIEFDADGNNNNANRIDPTESVFITFTANAPPSPVNPYLWATEAWVGANFSGTKYPDIGTVLNPGSQPSVIVNASTTISTQPQNSIITYGSATSFTVVGAGSGTLTYQWQQKIGAAPFTNIIDGGIYSGATTATLGLSKPTVAMSGIKYRVLVSGDCSPSATSAEAILTVTAFDVTGSFLADDKVYDATTAAVVTTGSRSVAVIFPNDVVSLVGGTATFDTKNVGVNKTVTLTGATLSGADAGNYNLVSVSTTQADITAFDVTGSFLADDKVYDATTAAVVTTGSRSVAVIFPNDVVSLVGGTATFDTKNVGVNKTVTLTGATLSGADAGNYNLVSVSTTQADITAFDVTGSFLADDKVYDATTAAVVTTGSRSVAVIFPNDVVSLVGGTATFDTKNVGVNKTVTLTGATLSGADAGNYNLVSVSTTQADITAFDVTGSFLADDKVYDATTAAVVTTGSRSVAVIFPNDVVSLVGGTATFDTKNVGVNKTVTLTGATLSGADAGNYNLVSVSTTQADITAFDVTGSFLADDKVYDATTAAVVTTGSRSVAVIFPNDVVSLVGGTATFDTKNVGVNKTVTLTGATLSGADAGNYNLVSVSTTQADITAFDVTGSFLADDKVYDATTAAVVTTGSRSVAVIFPNDVVSLVGGTATFDTKNVGVNKTVTLTGATLSGADAGNYNLVSVSTTQADITAFDVTGSFLADDKVYDATTAAVVTTGSRSVAVIFPNDVVSLVGGTATFDTKNVGVNKTVTLTGATLSGADAGNYNLVSVSTTQADITAFDVTGSFLADDKVYDATTAAVVTTGSRSVAVIFPNDVVSLVGGTATFDTKNVGVNKTVTLTGATLSGADAGNYNLVSVSTTQADITAFDVTGSFLADDKVYDATTAAVVTTGSRSVAVIFPNDVVSLVGGTATFDTKNVGVNKTVTLTGATLSGADAGNYNLVSVSTTQADITAFDVTGSFLADDKVYDATTAAVVTTGSRSVAVIFPNDVVSLVGGTATFDTKNVGVNKTVTLTGATLSGADAGNYNLVSVSTTQADITAFDVTGSFLADDKVYDATTAAVVTTGSRSVAVIFPNDVVSLVGGTATFDTKNVGVNKTVTLTGATLSGADAGNYNLVSVSTTQADITAFDVTGSFLADDKVYDATTAAVVTTGSRSVAVIFPNDVVSLVGGTATFDTKNVGVNKTVTLTGATLSGADAGNYNLVSVSTTQADITAFDVTGSFLADDKVYDATTAAVVTTGSRSVAVIFPNDVVSLVGGTATFDTKNVGVNKTVTLTGATLSGADAGNYNLVSVSTTQADITAFDVTGSFLADDKVYDATTAAVVTTGSRSVAVIFPNDVVSLVGGTATFDTKNVGVNKTVTLTGATLSGADAGNYNLVSVSTTQADITAFDVTGSFLADDKVYDATTAAVVTTGSRSVAVIFPNDVVSLVGGTATFDTKNVGVNKTVTLTGATLSGADAGNYNLVSVSTTQADITAFDVTGSFLADDKVYDATTAAVVTTGSRSVAVIFPNDVVSLVGGTATFDTKNVGVNKTVTLTGATLSGADAGNYNLVSVSTTQADITAFDVTGSFLADDKVYDATTAAVVTTGSRSVAVIFPNDVVSLVGGTATFDTKNVGVNKTVTLTGATLSGADAGNYNLVSVSTTQADITVRDITVTANGIDKIYDGNTIATVNLFTNKISGDVVTASYTTANFANANVGTWVINVSGIEIGGTDAANYNLVNTTATTSATILLASTTTTLITSAPSVRYMDNLTMTARVTPLNTGSSLTGSVHFWIGATLASATDYGSATVVPIPGSPDGSVEATLIKQVTNLPAGYTVYAVFTSSNANYDGSSGTKPLTVVARDADPYDAKGFYTGDVFAWTTGPNSSRGTVTMTAMIKDKNDPKGDVRGAKVTFCYVNNGVWSPIPSAKDIPVGLVDINDGSLGFASAIVQFDIGSQNAANYQIGVLVTGAYTNEDLINCGLSQVIVSVSKPIPGGFICGGSRLVNPATSNLSAGYIKGAPGLCTDYQFDVQYTKSGTNPKGKVKIMINSYYTRDGILDSKLHTYIVTTNAIASMNVVAPTGTFSAKANLVEQFDGYVEAIEGGSTFQMTAYQNGCDQKLAITLYRKAGGIWFSNSWDGVKTIQQPVAAGSKVYVGGAVPCSLNSVKIENSTITDAPLIRSTFNQAFDAFNVKVLGNPSLTTFRLQLQSNNMQEKFTVKVVDVNGRLIEVKQNLYAGQVIELGSKYTQGTYFAEVTQGANRKLVKLVKISRD